jgi:hypothetical protein
MTVITVGRKPRYSTIVRAVRAAESISRDVVAISPRNV